MSEPTFSADDAARTTKALRAALGLAPETFPLGAFLGMIGDELRALRAAGRTDAEIAALVGAATGKTVTADHLAAGEPAGSPALRPEDLNSENDG